MMSDSDGMETTVVLLKPDCLAKGLVGEVVCRLESLRLRIRGCKMIRADEDLLRDHYSHLADRPFFPEILEFMQSSPLIALALEGPGCVESVRRALGPTDSALAPKDTIRGLYGTDKMKNIAHASDSVETARTELDRFFRSSEIH